MDSHVNFLESVRRIIGASWGKDFPSVGDADKALVGDPQKLAAFGIIELLNILNRAAQAICDASDYDDDLKCDSSDIPDDAAAFPDTTVGDFLFRCWCFPEVARFAIVAAHGDHRVICRCDSDEYDQCDIRWATSHYCTTAQAAALSGANALLKSVGGDVEAAERLIAESTGGTEP